MGTTMDYSAEYNRTGFYQPTGFSQQASDAAAGIYRAVRDLERVSDLLGGALEGGHRPNSGTIGRLREAASTLTARLADVTRQVDGLERNSTLD